jgi:diguanylate cyclase (GGDEF)-like protein/PAS domain S-box-containing protein
MARHRTVGLEAEAFFSFGDLVSIASFSQLMDNFFLATGIPNGLVSPDGDIITQSGWLDACALFHRVHPEANRRCMESNLELMRDARAGEVVGAMCQNGLLDFATPVVLEGRQLATLFLGQVLDQPPDLAFFCRQAAQLGFDEERYLHAIRAVPVISRAQMEAHMGYMVGVAQMLAATGLARVRESRLEHDLHETTEQRIQMEDLLQLSPVGISWCNAVGELEYVNNQFSELFGYVLDDLPDLETWVVRAYPDAGYREAVLEPWARQMERARQSGAPYPELESTITCKDGRERRVLTRVRWVGQKRLANFTDITAQWRSQQRNRARGAVLEMVAKAEPLAEILHAVVTAVEAEEPTSRCSVLLADQAGERLLTGAAPSLPSFYVEATDGLEIGIGVGSSGAAAYLGERVVVEEISTHEYWRATAELAKRAGLAACWAEPIIASSGKVLGTFATYRGDPAAPGPEDLERIAFATNLAAIAIESENTRQVLIRRERIFRTLAENAPVSIARYNRRGRLIYVNPRFASLQPHPPDQLLGAGIQEWPDQPYAATFRLAVLHTLEDGEERAFETEMPGPDGQRTVAINMVAERDESGAVGGVLATGQDVSEHKRLEQELQRQARVDYLTGLTNRRHFIELAGMELTRVHRYGGELSLIMFDLDRFKRINDAHGHDVGDLVLKKIAQVSLDTMREADSVGRLGGEEFVILLPQTGSQQAVEAAERLRLAVSKQEVILENGTSLRFTASFGVATLYGVTENSGSEERIDSLLIRADAAMYEAKKSGRNAVRISRDPRDVRSAKQDMAMLEDRETL